jgi:methylated-DNA-[protein]-cysteine S-methyltransferase
MSHFLNYTSPLGELTLVASAHGLMGVYFEIHKYFQVSPTWQQDQKHVLLSETAQQLAQYFIGKRQQFTLPLDMSAGTAFQQKVWKALLDVPFGATASYRDIAKRIGQPKAVRAVGAANGRNPISIIVPCHRVIASSGALQGYAGGLVNKQTLLELEILGRD